MAEKTQRTVTEVLREQHELIKDLFDQVDTTTGEERAASFECLRLMLAVHETAEEEIVHPAVQAMGDGAAEAVRARLVEEDLAKRMLADLEKVGPGSEAFVELFERFQGAVLDHAESEEAEIFPFLEQGMDRTTLRNMADELEVAERMAPTHAHPHVPESVIGNLLVGPVVAIVDKVRDAIRHRAA